MTNSTSLVTRTTLIISLLAIAACTTAPQPAVNSVPVGSDVDLVRKDGVVITGKLMNRDDKTVTIGEGADARTMSLDEISDLRVADKTAPKPLPPIAKFREVTVPAKTKLSVHLTTAVASDTSHVEDPVEATLSAPVAVDGVDVFPAGSIVKGQVAAHQEAGKVKGRASLAIRFTSIVVAGRDEPSEIEARREFLAPSTKKKDTAKIAAPAAGGAIVGGIIGGKKGALIGTAVGGGAGTAVVMSTTGEEIRLASGAALTLELDKPVDVKVPIATP